MNKYQHIKNKQNYDKLLNSGMFWEFHPELTGIWNDDKIIIHDEKRSMIDRSESRMDRNYKKGLISEEQYQEYLLEVQLMKKEMSECKNKDCEFPKMKKPMIWGDDDISDYCGVSCFVDDLKRQLEDAKKSLGESINYRVFNLTADEAVIALRIALQLKEKGDE